MGYRGNLGCLWLLLIIALIGGTPLLVGLLRVFLVFSAVILIGGWLLTIWVRRNAIGRYTSHQSERHNRFVEMLVLLLTRLAELDGTIESREVTAIRTFFQRNLGYKDERLLWLRDLIKNARKSTEPVESICARLSRDYGIQERFIVIQVLASVAQADGVVSAQEHQFIHMVASHLGLDAFVGGFDFGTGAGPSARPGRRARVAEALSVLGLGEEAEESEIKRAWRKLSLENHPDRVRHLGEEFQTLAEQRMREINSAYDLLKAEGLVS